MLYSIMDQVVDEYAPVVAGLEDDIDEIEYQLFNNDPARLTPHALTREVIEVQRATRPLLDIIDSLSGGFDQYHVDIELQRHLRDVRDHVLRIVERIDAFRVLLQTR